MQAFKDAKRRIVQTAAENLGKAERVKKDEELMQEAMEGFKVFEADVKNLYETLKQAQAATAKWTERNLVLAETMSNFFSSEGGSLKTSAYQMSTSALRAHEIVQRSAVRVVEDRGVAALDALLNEKFPSLKKKITEHNNLETDVSSYTRRLKTMMEKKSGTDPEVMKIKEKLERTSQTYDQVHSDLLKELQTLVRERHNLVRPVYVATLAAYSELQSVLSEEFNQSMETINGPDVEQVRKEISYLVESGGPPQEIQKGGGMMKGLFKGNSTAAGLKAANTMSESSASGSLNRSFGSNSSSPSKLPASSPKNTPITAFNFSNRAPPPPVPMEMSENKVEEARVIEPPISNGNPNGFTSGISCVAIFDYEGPDPGDLSFKAEDRIRMEVEVSPGWWNGTREVDGQYGLFPETYVRRIE